MFFYEQFTFHIRFTDFEIMYGNQQTKRIRNPNVYLPRAANEVVLHRVIDPAVCQIYVLDYMYFIVQM